MNKPHELSKTVIFPKGQKIPNDHFLGTAWLQTLVSMDSVFNCSVSNVTFEAGARNNWHRHPGGQILLVTGGKGYFQEEGKPARVIKAGDVVKIMPGVKHWHGAGLDSWLTHLAIGVNPQKGDMEWLEPVRDNEYLRLKIEPAT